MSATFKLAKKKVSQHDLRKLMIEQKNLRSNSDVKRIDSPFAKYDDSDQLNCQLCQKRISSPAVWKVHINSKQHKDNLAHAKQLKQKLEDHVKVPTIQERVAAMKQDHQMKGNLKGILKNSSTSSSHATNSSEALGDEPKPGNLQDLVALKSSRGPGNDGKNNSKEEKMVVDETLPEGFFDDPVKDAKARNLEYKNPIEEEFEKFKKEIKEAEDHSMVIITDEQEESTAERQIDEIDAQIKNWSRVLELEKKKEQIVSKPKSEVMQVETDSQSSSEDEEDISDILDWRAKKGHI